MSLRGAIARACRERSVAEAISDEENIAMQVRQSLLSSSCAAELLDRAQSLKDGIAKDLVFDPDRLVNLNGAKETELKFGDQFKGR